MYVDAAWIAAALEDCSPGQLLARGQSTVPAAIERVDSLLRAWAVGFAERRQDVTSSALIHGRRGLHDDECAAFLRALDARLVHVDSAGFARPIGLGAQTNRQPYALCCKSAAGVGVNLEYIIQLGVLGELHSVLGWPLESLRMELGEFDAAVVDEDGAPLLVVEAKARARSSAKIGERMRRTST